MTRTGHDPSSLTRTGHLSVRGSAGGEKCSYRPAAANPSTLTRTGHLSAGGGEYKCILFNSRSVKNKLNDLHHLLYCDNPDIVCITETWLNDSVPDHLITDNNLNYNVTRTDRSGNVSHGGGVAILHSTRFVTSSIDIPPQFRHVEICAVDIYLQPNTPIRLFTCYRPPSSSNRDHDALSYITDLCNCLDSLMPSSGSVILCGDMNFPAVNWSSPSCSMHSCSYTCSGIFINFVLKHGLTQLVDSPTHGSNIIDLVLTNDVNCILNTQVSAPFSTSDHNCVITNIILPNRSNNSYNHCCSVTDMFYDFNNADWNSIRSYLASVDFNVLFNSDLSVPDIFTAFYNIVYRCLNMYVPKRPSNSKNTTKIGKRKYPAKIRKLLNKKLAAWKVYRRTRKPQHLTAYKARAADCQSAINSYISERENKLIDSGNLGAFYRYSNGKLCSQSSIGALVTNDGRTITDPSEKAELLNENFRNNFTIDNNCIPINHSLINQHQPSCNLSNVIFTTSSVENAIKKLKNKVSSGPDKLPPTFLKHCCSELSAPLAHLFTLGYEFNYLPPIWLSALITPLFKKGKHTDPSNYRPIALTSTLSKLMEAIIKDQTLNYLLHNNFITKDQHGFIKRHSTVTNLLECTNDWLISLNCSKSTDVVYIDFSKAFDSIVFTKLLYKLQCYGISGNLLRWVTQFLHGRTQSVVVDNCNSTYCDVISGVPQGSVLGPLLFIIFINDISSICEEGVTMKLFADDAKIYTEIGVNDNSLQRSLDNLVRWCSDWQLTINISKCCVLSINSSSCNTCYSINGTTLKVTNNVLDLGINITASLDFKSHICNIVSKSLQRSSVFFRGFTSRSPILLKKAFITYIRPILEYNCILWSPTSVHMTDLLESVQRKFTKRIPSLNSMSYPERLAALNLESLELRRLKFDIINYFKILSLNSNPELSNRFLVHIPPPAARPFYPRPRLPW